MMCAIRFRVFEEEEEREEKKEEEAPPEMWMEEEEAEKAAEWRERPFFLSLISIGLGSLGLLLLFTAVSLVVIYFVPVTIYIPGLGFLMKPGEIGGSMAGYLTTAGIMIAVGIASYVAGYGLWHFRHWALALSLALAALGLVFGIGITILHAEVIRGLTAYFGGGLGEEQVGFLHATTLITAVLVIGPAAFLIAYMVNIRHFFE